MKREGRRRGRDGVRGERVKGWVVRKGEMARRLNRGGHDLVLGTTYPDDEEYRERDPDIRYLVHRGGRLWLLRGTVVKRVVLRRG